MAESVISLKIKIWTLFLAGLILIVSYTALFVHVLRGNRNKWLMGQAVLVILAGFTYVTFAYGYWTVYIKHEVNLTNIWLIGCGSGFSDGFQALVHFFLAMKYQSIAKNIPRTIEGKDPEPETRCQKCFYWSTLFLCCVGGPLKMIASATFRTKNMVQHVKPGKFLKIFVPVSFDLIGGCQILLGAILIYSVFQIRRFFKERNDEGYIDI
jgi:hypothetical protein